MTKKKRRVYKPCVVGDRIMMPADLKRLHKYMLEIEGVDAISDEMRAGRGKRMAGLELHSRTGSASV